ncbi:MAG: late competence development ComFB family protein [Thermodesulfobacteriota bacterium]
MGNGKKTANKYQYNSVDLSGIRNRNELRVINMMGQVLQSYPDFSQDVINIQDIYALALNLLPSRYTQGFSIVLKEPVTDEQISDALHKAVQRVRDNPTGPDKKYESD